MASAVAKKGNESVNQKKECFVIMPISDHKDYETGHFRRVYEDIITPACKEADYTAFRADDIEETDIIHLSILKRLIDAPMAICDLSTRNPNVLFELGLRQAFDKPVVLIQEKGTERIFDVSILRAYEYCKELRYNEVLHDQESIAKMLKGTEQSFVTGKGFNSVIKLLSLSKEAQIKTIDDPNEQFRMQLFQLSSQMDSIGSELRMLRNRNINIIENFDYEEKVPIEDKMLKSYYMEFLHFYNRGNLDEMIKIFNIVRRKFALTKDTSFIREMRNKIFELKGKNDTIK